MTTTKAEEILALVLLYLKRDKPQDALDLLERSKKEFITIGAENLWKSWHGQALVAMGDASKVLEAAMHEADPTLRRNLKTLALREIASKNGDWEPLIAHLEESFEETGDGEFLLNLSYIKFQLSDWNYIADRVNQLILSIGTADAVRLSATAAWNAGRAELCLNILDQHKDVFSGGTLPGDMWRLRVDCQVKMGALSAAVIEAEELVRKESSTVNIITLMDAQARKGDLKGIVLTSRLLLPKSDVQPIYLLKAARFVQFEDPELAKEFWRRVKGAALEKPSLLAEALGIGYQLGLDAEMRPLVERMQTYAEKGEGPFKFFRLTEVRSRLEKHSENLNELNRMYDAGEIPIHLFSQSVNVPLVEILHGIPQQNRAEQNPHHQLRVYTRYGGRSIQKDITEFLRNKRLHLDITSILLAQDLGVLEKVERCFKPLRISPNLQTALIAQRDSLRPNQQRRIETYKRIDSILGSGKAQLIPEAIESPDKLDDLKKKMEPAWVATLIRAQEECGFVVDYLPLTTNDLDHEPIILPVEFQRRVINCRAIVESLRANGPLSPSVFHQKIEALGYEGTKDLSTTVPPLRSKLFLIGNIASTLADADLLDLVCNEFDVFIDPYYVQILRNSLRGQEYYLKLEKWLGRLEDQIREGLDTGVYECVSISGDLLAEGAEREEIDNLDFLTLRELLLFSPEENDVLWIDDRLLNSYAHRDGVPIITINEILWALRQQGELTEREYYDALLNLRSGNIRYIPIDSKEILYHLYQAQVQNSTVAETNELLILRKYLAACLLDTERLQRIPILERVSNKTGELPFVQGVVTTIADALVTVWTENEKDIDTLEARANYLLNNFFTGIFGTRHFLPKDDTQNDGIDLIGFDIGSLFGQGISLAGKVGPKDSPRRRQFFSWLQKRMALHRLKADPGAIIAAARTLRTLIGTTTARQTEKAEDESFLRLIFQGFFLDLPKQLTDELKLNPEIMDWIGISLVDSVQYDKLVFSASDFWVAVKKAINGDVAPIFSLDQDTEYIIKKKASDDSNLTIEIQDAIGMVVGKISDPIFGLLSQDPNDREAVLKRFRFWFDSRQDVFEKQISEIIAIEDPVKRIKHVDPWRKHSAEVFYRNLYEKIRTSKEFDWSDLLPPSADGLVRHFRLEAPLYNGNDFHAIISHSALLLLSEEGLETTLYRLTCLPLKIPKFVLEELEKLPSLDRNNLLKKLSSQCASPVSKLHLIDIGMHLASIDTGAVEFAKLAITELFNQEKGGDEFRLFKAILEFTNDEFGYWAETKDWPPIIRLVMVWAHTSKLHNLFHAVNVIPDKLAEGFESQDSPISIEVLSREPEYWNDVLHPHRLNRPVFLIHAVSYVLLHQRLEALGDLDIASLIREKAFTKGPEGKFPAIPLLVDPNLLTDKLGSFLGGDRGELLTSVLGEEGRILNSSNLKNNVEQALERLKVDVSDYYAWVIIRAVLGDMPIYSEFQEDLKTILGGIDLISIYRNKPTIALQFLYLASSQLPYFGDDNLRSRYIMNLIHLARMEAGKKKDDAQSSEHFSVTDKIDGWFNIALALSIRPGDPRSSSKAFGEIIQSLLTVMPSIADHMGHIVLKLVFELPLRQLHGLWPVLLATRSFRKDPL
ncbi:MAG: hypothetical protein ACLGJB_17570 [Blastocatellia bacterium]